MGIVIAPSKVNVSKRYFDQLKPNLIKIPTPAKVNIPNNSKIIENEFLTCPGKIIQFIINIPTTAKSKFEDLR
jgi:hypothetical protein